MDTHFAKPHLTNRQVLHICTWAQNTEEGREAKPHSWLGCTEATTILKESLVGTINVTLCLVTQSCATLCYPMDGSPPGSSVRGDSPSKNTAVGCHALLQRIFPTQGLNPGFPHYRWIIYHLSHQGSPRILEWVAHPFILQGIFLIQESNRGLLHCRQILYQLSYQGSPLILCCPFYDIVALQGDQTSQS